MTGKKWFVLVGDEEMGPLGPRGLHKLVDRGELTPDTLLRREDREQPVAASKLAGLFPRAPAEHSGHAPAHEDYTPLRPLGWTVAGILLAWALLAVYGVITAVGQYGVATQIADGEPLPASAAEAPFLGVGGVVAAFLFLATGVLFVYWLWLARANIPALILARYHYPQAWTIAAWLVPVVNLLQPYQVMSEVDRLTAEAYADGDARVHENPWLLGPWWICTLLLVAATITYGVMTFETGGELVFASLLHAGTAVLAIAAAAFAAIVVVRITELQERAHQRHAEPVKLHRTSKRRRTAHA